MTDKPENKLTILVTLRGDDLEKFEAAFKRRVSAVVEPARITRTAYAEHLVRVGLATEDAKC